MMISVEVTVMVMEIRGGMAKEEVDEVYNSLIPSSKKVKQPRAFRQKGELPPPCINQAEPTNRVTVLWKAWPL